LKNWTNSISRNWSFVYGLSALIVDGRLAEHGSGPAEAVATCLTYCCADSRVALTEHPVSGIGGSNPSSSSDESAANSVQVQAFALVPAQLIRSPFP
jgi:hypothetical protein